MGHCIVIDVDGEPVRIQLAVPESELTKEDREGIEELVRLVRNRADEKEKSAAGKPVKQIESRRRKIKIVRKK